jgi:hypothetical protein
MSIQPNRECCGTCHYFLPVTKFPSFHIPAFDGKPSEHSKLSVCTGVAENNIERVVVPTTPGDMCELYRPKDGDRQVQESKG